MKSTLKVLIWGLFLWLHCFQTAAAANYSTSYSVSTSGKTTIIEETRNGKTTVKKIVNGTPVPVTTDQITPATETYTIDSFDSKIRVNQDTTMSVEETISTNFLVPKHGIFRIIPYIYSANGKTIRAKISKIKVTNENGIGIPYTTERVNQSISIKIGEADKTIRGKNIYVISYEVSDVILDYGNGPEIYWNVTGHEWDTTIYKARATVESPYGKIEKTICYSGNLGGQEKNCTTKNSDSQAEFTTNETLGNNKDFTVVIQISKNNLLKFPGTIEKIIKATTDNWGYAAALLPLILMGYYWYTKGRDKKYSSGNIYYKPEKTNEENVPLLSRPHLPLVYGPIDNLSPAEAGTINDQKVDLKDIVAEIMELGRLGYLTIERTEKKKFLGNDIDYIFKSTEKDASTLTDYQQYLLESIFDSKTTEGTTNKETEKIIYKGEEKLSDLKDKFYVHLEPLRKKIYDSLIKKGAIQSDPRKVQGIWFIMAFFLNLIAFMVIVYFVSDSGNAGPLGIWAIGLIPSMALAAFMPSRTAWGYSLYRQTEGLKYYVSKGKWREEIAEKRLFLEEILPLAIALGVVDKLAKDMEVLGLQPPSYFVGDSWGNFGSSFYHFNHYSYSTFISTPVSTSYHSGWSGNSSWSGGSGFGGGGFSGGSSGGGFGGGGGGSW
ncbi:MAG TPA: DUF2207 domain-containing protein [Patescibacteria group bacterium]